MKASPRRAVLAAGLLVALAVPFFAAAQSSSTVEEKFREVGDLRSRGEYDRAIDVLSNMITEFAQSDDVLRRAYNQLVWTLVAKRNDLRGLANEAAGTPEADAMLEEIEQIVNRIGVIVGEALTRFPDLKAGSDVPDPDKVNDIYEPTRQAMFGSLFIETDPDSAAVWINRGDDGWHHEGWTPLRHELFPVGTYEVKLSKDGHKEKTLSLQVQANATTRQDVALQRARGRLWWVTRVFAPVTATAAVVAYLLSSGDDETDPPVDPLPEPPDPPSQ